LNRQGRSASGGEAAWVWSHIRTVEPNAYPASSTAGQPRD